MPATRSLSRSAAAVGTPRCYLLWAASGKATAATEDKVGALLIVLLLLDGDESGAAPTNSAHSPSDDNSPSSLSVSGVTVRTALALAYRPFVLLGTWAAWLEGVNCCDIFDDPLTFPEVEKLSFLDYA